MWRAPNMTGSSSYKLLLSIVCPLKHHSANAGHGHWAQAVRDFRFQLPLSGISSSLLCRDWLLLRIRKSKSMKKSSGGNDSSFSKGKQLGKSESTWSTGAAVSVNYRGMRVWPVFVKYLEELWCLLNVNPASMEAELISFLLEETVESSLLNLKVVQGL